MKNSNLTMEQVIEAKKRIAPYIYETPLLYSQRLSEIFKCNVYIKPEMLQITGSFKIRGALNRILQLTQEEREKGIICSSSGNHGKACAYLGKKLGIDVNVVLPEDAPLEKAKGIESLGGKVIYGPRLYDDRWKMVKEETEKNNYTIVHAYEDYEVMAGQGTVALEVLNTQPKIDTFVIPVGGGGLISGIATVAKSFNKNCKIVGVQASSGNAYAESRKCGHPVEVPCEDSLADGISCRKPGINPYPIIEQLVDEFMSVGEEEIAAATKLFADTTKLIAEPTSCVGIGAFLANAYQPSPDENICFVITSGNWDIDELGKLYQ